MARRKNELVSVSFHFLRRETKGDGGEPQIVPISAEEFEAVVEGILNQRTPDLGNEKDLDLVRYGAIVPFTNLRREGTRLLLGTFEAPYTGHSFMNSEKGKISAESVNQRKFHFLLYHSDDGRVFVGSQYLGAYGGYEILKSGILNHFRDKDGLKSYSYRRELFDPENLHAKEIRVDIAKAADTFEEDNSLTKKSSIVLKRDGRKDLQFEEAVRRDLLPVFTSDVGLEGKKRGLARVLNDTGLIQVEDSEVENCTMLATVDGRTKTYHFFEVGSFATKYPISVKHNDDGHPESDETFKAMIERLKREVIANL